MNLTEWAKAQGVHPHTAYRWFREGTLPVPATRVGRARMNGARSKARRLLADPDAVIVVVEHRDRLGRVNTELMVEVLTWFCARLYGRRSAKNRALKALEAAEHG